MKLLDLGCGITKRQGAIGVDVIDNDVVDIIHDLDVHPYPFGDNSFDDILMDNSIEHLSDVVKTMEELWRISKPGAKLTIKVPYFRSHYAIDPTHKQYFVAHSFYYFDPEHEFHQFYKYSDKAFFNVEKVVFDEDFKYNWIYKLWLTIPRWVANRHPMHYERYLGPHFPMNCITYYLRARK
jgi:predicted SAM-dependent methyltransferase